MLIRDLGEHGLIARIRARVPADPDWVTLGIGDDAAVLEPPRGELDVVTTDSLVEDVHFKRSWSSMTEVGRNALAVNVSDLAAMGATPRAATLSLALPPTLPVGDLDKFLDGFLGLATEVRVPLVGGNITRSPGPIVIDVTLIGAARRRRVLTRRGGRPSHRLYVTGTLGRAAAEVARLLAGPAPGDPPYLPRLPREAALLRCGVQVARSRAASAAMDLSDGLADAVQQVAGQSGTGARIYASTLPVDAVAVAWADRQGTGAEGALQLAVHGGEDYELLFAVPPRHWRGFEAVAGRETPIRCIGELTSGVDVLLVRDDAGGRTTPLGSGFTHF